MKNHGSTLEQVFYALESAEREEIDARVAARSADVAHATQASGALPGWNGTSWLG